MESLSLRVLDEQQQKRHFNQHDLQELYNFQPAPKLREGEKPKHECPKDELLADLLLGDTGTQCISSYHEHDSLLDHQPHQALTEEERKAAWEEYNNEKKARVPPPQQNYNNRFNYQPIAAQQQYQLTNYIQQQSMYQQLLMQNNNHVIMQQNVLLPQEQQAVDKMIDFHRDMGSFFKSDTLENQKKIDDLFNKLIRLKKVHIISTRKLSNLPAISPGEARASIAAIQRLRQGQFMQMPAEQQVAGIVANRKNERGHVMREMKICKEEFDAVLNQYETSLSATPAYQQLKKQSEEKEKQQQQQANSDVNVGASTSGTSNVETSGSSNGSQIGTSRANGH